MKRVWIGCILAVWTIGMTGCGGNAPAAPENAVATDAVTEAVTTEPMTETEIVTEEKTQPETVEVIEVVEEGMVPVTAEALKDGDYDVTVDSSSSMFRIDSAVLHVADGAMTADLTMSGTGYLYLFMGTGETAETADESERISYTENADGQYVFTVPVEALDAGIECAAYSKRKEIWYDRTLLFRMDSLPTEAFADSIFTDPASLELTDGSYTVDVTLEGGSGKASVQSPAKLTVADGNYTAEIIWSSNKYDYMVVDGEKIEPVSMEEFSVFEIPVIGFDYKMPVSADTTAMSKPHEIGYTLYFDSESITE
ncbi:MAG: hypothetical protein K6F80_03660 [Oscillospiraceae bacterium]|nr:hypothetical protein [Oscillospiraceae bacterium]